MSTLTRVLLLASAVALTAFAQENCASCHDQGEKTKGTVHADLGCVVCHSGFEEYPHPSGSSDFRRTIPDTCGMCHDKVAEDFNSSVHGQAAARGVREAPVCT